uniref:Uncharacterized protein n=1 Tax=Pundamilia nyererei TaxID=303518 RepID=A0A3B4FTE0_9CICH
MNSGEQTEFSGVLSEKGCAAQPFQEWTSHRLMSVTVFPVRLLLVSFLMLLAWPFAFTASLGRSEFAIEPQSWWRRWVCVKAPMCY